MLLHEPQLSDVENKALNHASVINKEDEPSTRTSNQYHENNISESANVINLSVEKSSSCRGEQLHEIGKLTTNNKTSKALFQLTRKSSISCTYLFGRGWCIKESKCDYSHQNTGREKNESLKSEAPRLFLKKRDTSYKTPTVSTTKKYVSIYPHLPTLSPLSTKHWTRSKVSFFMSSPRFLTPSSPPSLMNVPTWPPRMY
jgi:hypothetical protein